MLTQAQRLLQVLASDPSLRGVIQALQFGLLGVQGGQITLDAMTWPLTLGANTLEQVNAGRPANFSWRDLVQGRAATPGELRRFFDHPGDHELFGSRTRTAGERRHPQGRR